MSIGCWCGNPCFMTQTLADFLHHKCKDQSRRPCNFTMERVLHKGDKMVSNLGYALGTEVYNWGLSSSSFFSQILIRVRVTLVMTQSSSLSVLGVALLFCVPASKYSKGSYSFYVTLFAFFRIIFTLSSMYCILYCTVPQTSTLS